MHSKRPVYSTAVRQMNKDKVKKKRNSVKFLKPYLPIKMKSFDLYDEL